MVIALIAKKLGHYIQWKYWSFESNARNSRAIEVIMGKTRVHDLVARDNCVSAIHNNKYEDYSVQYPHGGLHLKSDMNCLVIWATVASTFHLEKQRGNEAGKYTETTAATTTDQHSWVLSSSSRGMLSNYKSDYAAELQQRRN